MGTWKNSRMITLCPECEKAQVRLAKGGGKTKAENRIYHCPRCKAVYTNAELTINWRRADSRPNLEVVVSFGGWLKVKPLAPASEEFV